MATWISVSQGRDLSLVILTHSPVARNPTECSLYHPSARLNTEPTLTRFSLHHFQFPLSLRYAPTRQLLSAVGGIRPDLLQMWYKAFQSGEETARPSGVVDIGLGHVDRKRNAQRIHQNMAFAPFHMFVRIKAADASRLLNRFHTDAASMMAALGCRFLPCRSRSARWSMRRRRVQIPLRRKRRK